MHPRWLTIALAALVVYTIVRFGILAVQPPGMIPNDYTLYHVTCDRMRAGELIYDPDHASPFKYSPTFMGLFCSTFDVMGKHAAWPWWSALSAIAFAMATFFVLQWALTTKVPFAPAQASAWPSARTLAPLVILATIFGWHGYLEHFSYGQVDFVLFGVFVASVLLAEPQISKRHRWAIPAASFLFSLILITKPQMGIWLAYFLIRRQWSLLALTATFTGALMAAPALFWGSDRLLQLLTQWKFSIGQQKVEFLTGNLNQSLAASLARLSGDRSLVLTLTPLFVAIGAFTTVVLTSRLRRLEFSDPRLRARVFIWVISLYLLITPLSWRWLTFMWIPLAAFMFHDALVSMNRWMKGVLILFALNGLLLQRIVANTVGISEVDEMSFAGLYTLGSLALFIASSVSLRQAWRSQSSTTPRA